MQTKTTYLGFIVWAGHVTIGCGQNSRPAFKQTVVEIFGVQTFWQFQPMVKTTVAFFVVGAAAREKKAKKKQEPQSVHLQHVVVTAIAAAAAGLLLTGVHG